eukprot:TCONS_00048875-protein
MKSSNDGRPWGERVSSRTEEHGKKGARKKAKCLGSYVCKNDNCLFYRYYNKPNKLHFKKQSKTCKICGTIGEFVECKAVKVWEFDDAELIVVIKHNGNHTCEAKKKQEVPDVVYEKFSNNPKASATQVSEDIIIDAIDRNEPWEEIYKLVDSTLCKENLYYAKKKATSDPHGQSFEAVAILKSKIATKDPYFIYRINDRSMNESPSFVFKMSKVQADIAYEMDENKGGMLNGEYCYIDGTFKRCKGYVTLAAYVYLGLLRKMVKLATMEAETEHADNWTKFWHLFNEVLEKHKGSRFSPVAWCTDEAGGIWKALKVVFGEDAVKHKTVSCEKHFLWSVDRYTISLRNVSNAADFFKETASKLMTSVTSAEYLCALQELKEFIDTKPTKRGFLRSFIEFWDQRRHHFSRAFKHGDAPNTNLSEAYHSSYVTANNINLSLVEAAYRDTVTAIRLDRSLVAFGDGSDCQGYGPTTEETTSRSKQKQKEKVRH